MPSNVLRPINAVTPAQIEAILPIVCPGCGREGNFQSIGQDLVLQIGSGKTAQVVQVGHRLCPNLSCRTHIFGIYEFAGMGGKLIRSYPAGRIQFDSASVPLKVTDAFVEALTCAANECYIAAGMLIRKTLEAVCEDCKTKSGNLFERIEDLRTKIILSQELFDAMHQLRLLGNDAAHIDAKSYDDVGKEEIDAAIDVTKEVIKATYQHKDLLAKLKALKKPSGQ